MTSTGSVAATTLNQSCQTLGLEMKGGHNVQRNNYRTVQTPQTFDIQQIKHAFDTEYSDNFTDDASVAEAAGMKITMVDGNRENIKLTTPYDLLFAEFLCKQ